MPDGLLKRVNMAFRPGLFVNHYGSSETYARVAGIWMFRHKRSEPLMSVPLETGGATARFA